MLQRLKMDESDKILLKKPITIVVVMGWILVYLIVFLSFFYRNYFYRTGFGGQFTMLHNRMIV